MTGSFRGIGRIVYKRAFHNPDLYAKRGVIPVARPKKNMFILDLDEAHGT